MGNTNGHSSGSIRHDSRCVCLSCGIHRGLLRLCTTIRGTPTSSTCGEPWHHDGGDSVCPRGGLGIG